VLQGCMAAAYFPEIQNLLPHLLELFRYADHNTVFPIITTVSF